MVQRAEQTDKLLFDLLREWGGALLSLQISLPGAPEADGGIVCPCCKMIHGRCHEAVYPLMYLARRTGDGRYLASAKRLFAWGDNMINGDGSLRNDAKSDWRGVTVFGVVALHDSLFHHGDLLSADEKAEWENRLRNMGEWLYENLVPGKIQAYINYYAANACAMALLGRYFASEKHVRRGRELVEFCLSRISPSGLIYGEGHPVDVVTAKGCRAIDAGGYNAEETLPSLTRCAGALGDEGMLERCRGLWRAHLAWMLPDGAWDDSAGSRAFKWTYWGSRTSDGCQDALFFLGKKDAVFAEAALRNTELLARCTHGGLLHGGPDYYRQGEKPCVHHTFCHAKALATSLDNGLYDFTRTELPAETACQVTEYPELDTLRITVGDRIADISGYDYFPFPGAHASGGALSLLWNRKTGPLIACGAADYTVREPFNQQLPSDPAAHLCTCPRLEAVTDNSRFAQHYDRNAVIKYERTPDGVIVRVGGCLCDKDGVRFAGDGSFRLSYEFGRGDLRVKGQISSELAPMTRFVLPLIGDVGVTVIRGEMIGTPRPFFNLNPGFAGLEYAITPDSGGEFEFILAGPRSELK